MSCWAVQITWYWKEKYCLHYGMMAHTVTYTTNTQFHTANHYLTALRNESPHWLNTSQVGSLRNFLNEMPFPSRRHFSQSHDFSPLEMFYSLWHFPIPCQSRKWCGLKPYLPWHTHARTRTHTHAHTYARTQERKTNLQKSTSSLIPVLRFNKMQPFKDKAKKVEWNFIYISKCTHTDNTVLTASIVTLYSTLRVVLWHFLDMKILKSIVRSTYEKVHCFIWKCKIP